MKSQIQFQALFLRLGTRRRYSFMSRPIYPQWKGTWYQLDWRLGAPHGGEQRNPTPAGNRSQVEGSDVILREFPQSVQYNVGIVNTHRLQKLPPTICPIHNSLSFYAVGQSSWNQESIQLTSHLIFSSRLLIGLPSGLFLWGFLIKFYNTGMNLFPLCAFEARDFSLM